MNTVTHLQGSVTMSKTDSTTIGFAGKPSKPHPDFPLFPHATRRWAKKVNKQCHYFGVWSDPRAALARPNREYPFCAYRKTCEALLAHVGKERRADDPRPDDFRACRATRAKRFGCSASRT